MAIAETKRRAFAAWDYWGKPIPNFGSPDARLLIVGLAPAAHGANRTGRMFTGDRSGDFLYPALHRAGFATQPHSTHRGDGLELRDAVIAAAAHCAPPDNKPTHEELETCSAYLVETARLMPNLRCCVALGKVAFDACVKLYRVMGWDTMKPVPRFAHGIIHRFRAAPFFIGSYHPSQQNTFTGKLTAPMMEQVFLTAADLIALSPDS